MKCLMALVLSLLISTAALANGPKHVGKGTGNVVKGAAQIVYGAGETAMFVGKATVKVVKFPFRKCSK